MTTTPYVSRSGRLVKKPILYEPVERPEDDFKEDEYDEDDDDEEDEEDDEDEEDEDDEDADECGNLKGFVIEDEEEEEDDCD
jgi:hypothetical protein